METTICKEKSLNLAKKGKKGNLICKFTCVGSDDLFELRECPVNKDIYMVWWEWSEKEKESSHLDNFSFHSRIRVEELFEEDSWSVFGKKCKRSIFKK